MNRISENSSLNPIKLESLQVFRGVAAMAVVFYHIDVIAGRRLDISFLDSAFSLGYLGVDFFFVLSGFIIAHVHLKDAKCPQRAPVYFAKRFFRIVPLLMIMNLIKIVYVMTGFPGIADDKKQVGVILSSFFMLPSENLPLIDVAWTLRHELFFYLLFGIVVLFGNRMGLILSAVIVIGSVGLNITSFESVDFLMKFVFSPYNLQFILGISVAILFARFSEKIMKSAFLMITLGVVFLLGLLFVSNTYVSQHFLLQRFLYGLSFSLIIIGGVGLDLKRIITWPRVLTFLGDASYSIYLVHSSVQVLFVIILMKLGFFEKIYNQWILGLIGFLSILGSLLVWKFIERPLNQYSSLLIKKFL